MSTGQPNKIWKKLTLLGLIVIMLVPAGALANDFRVITLGTGAPPPEMDRFGPATLVEAGDQRLLFDAGRGAAQQLWQKRIPLGSIDQVFITHLHSDHIVGLPDLYLTSLLPGPFGLRKQPFQIMGAGGTETMMAHMKQALQADIDIRSKDGEYRHANTEIVAKDIVEGVVYEKNGVIVTAFDNFHGEAIKPSLGFRIDYNGHSVVISGDTKYSENVIKHSQGVDLLIHTVAMANKELLKQDNKEAKIAERILAHHCPPEDVARVFNQIKPKMAAFTHMVVISTDRRKYPPPKQEEIVAETRAAGYNGPLVIAKDLMTFEIGDTVNVVPFKGGKAFTRKNPD